MELKESKWENFHTSGETKKATKQSHSFNVVFVSLKKCYFLGDYYLGIQYNCPF